MDYHLSKLTPTDATHLGDDTTVQALADRIQRTESQVTGSSICWTPSVLLRQVYPTPNHYEHGASCRIRASMK